MPRRTDTYLTDLEGAVLGFIIRAGSCTTYAVRDSFKMSPSDFWSGSAGAVYPLIERLEARGYIVSTADRTDRRMRRFLSATAEGKSAFIEWLTDAERAAGLGFDPLRIRLFFSDLIPENKKRSFISETEKRLRIGTPPPSAALPHVLPLHKAWMHMRRAVFRAYTKSVEADCE